MRAPTISRVLNEMYPGKCGIYWQLTGYNYENIEWITSDVGKPSEEDINSRLEQCKVTYLSERVRYDRDMRLTATDFLTVSDFPFPSDQIRQAWLTYRQELRNVPATTSTPYYNDNNEVVVDWPNQPIWPVVKMPPLYRTRESFA
tara:strand:+ start:518 stop:952 length:435 start_codon:yes stop_codon:yes gene_type:complete